MGQSIINQKTNSKIKRKYYMYASIAVSIFIIILMIFNLNDNLKLKYYEFIKNDAYLINYIKINLNDGKKKVYIIDSIDKIASTKKSNGTLYLESILTSNKNVPDYIYESIIKSFNKYDVKFKDSKVICNFIYSNDISGNMRYEIAKYLNKYNSDTIQDDCIKYLNNMFNNGKVIEGINLIKKYKAIGVGKFGKIYNTNVPIDKMCNFYFLENYSDSYKNDLKEMLLRYSESDIDAQIISMIKGFYDDGDTNSIKRIIKIYTDNVIGKNDNLIKLNYLYENEDENNKQVDVLNDELKSSKDLNSDESWQKVKAINNYQAKNSDIENQANEILKSLS